MKIGGRELVLIAEVKTESPFGFKAAKSWDDIFKFAESVGDIISVHTDKRWGGSFELITRAKRLTDKPVLAKGIHANDADIKKAFEAGADLCLVVGRIPDMPLDKLLLEPKSIAEFKKIPAGSRAVWNSRDLSTGGLKRETFEQARSSWEGWLCQASNISRPEDVFDGADAILVGEHLEGFVSACQISENP